MYRFQISDNTKKNHFGTSKAKHHALNGTTTSPRTFLKLTSLTVILLLLFSGSYAGLVWVHAASGPAIQYGPTVLSGSATTAKEPAVQTSSNGQYVYVAWTQGGGGIFFTYSTNYGASFVTAFKISDTRGTAQYPVTITGDGYQNVPDNDAYVAWSQSVSGTLQTFVASSTNYGVQGSWTVTQVSSVGGITSALAAFGSNVYVTWYQNTPCPATALNPGGKDKCVYVDASTNEGATWSTPVELEPSSGIGENQIVATQIGNTSVAYVVGDSIYFESYNVPGSNMNWHGSGSTSTGWTTPELVYSTFSYNGLNSFGREPWVAAYGSDVYITWEAVNVTSSSAHYSDYGITSTDGGLNWYPGTCNASTCPSSKITSFPPSITTAAQQAQFSVSKQAPDMWEPENVAINNSAFVTMHSLHNQGVYVSSTTNSGASWSTPVEVNSGLKGTSAFGHIFTSDGTNVWVMWGQETGKGSSVWNSYVAYSGNSGQTWSSPLDISNNAAGVAAGNQDVTLFWVSSIGATCFAVYTYTNGGTSQVWFTAITG